MPKTKKFNKSKKVLKRTSSKPSIKSSKSISGSQSRKRKTNHRRREDSNTASAKETQSVEIEIYQSTFNETSGERDDTCDENHLFKVVKCAKLGDILTELPIDSIILLKKNPGTYYKFKCPNCDKDLKCLKTGLNHARHCLKSGYKYDILIRVREVVFICINCVFTCPDMDELIDHKSSCKSYSNILFNYYSIHKDFVCVKCGFSCLSCQVYKSHRCQELLACMKSCVVILEKIDVLKRKYSDGQDIAFNSTKSKRKSFEIIKKSPTTSTSFTPYTKMSSDLSLRSLPKVTDCTVSAQIAADVRVSPNDSMLNISSFGDDSTVSDISPLVPDCSGSSQLDTDVRNISTLTSSSFLKDILSVGPSAEVRNCPSSAKLNTDVRVSPNISTTCNPSSAASTASDLGPLHHMPDSSGSQLDTDVRNTSTMTSSSFIKEILYLGPFAEVRNCPSSAKLNTDVRVSPNISTTCNPSSAASTASDLGPLDHVPVYPCSAQLDKDHVSPNISTTCNPSSAASTASDLGSLDHVPDYPCSAQLVKDHVSPNISPIISDSFAGSSAISDLDSIAQDRQDSAQLDTDVHASPNISSTTSASSVSSIVTSIISDLVLLADVSDCEGSAESDTDVRVSGNISTVTTASLGEDSTISYLDQLTQVPGYPGSDQLSTDVRVSSNIFPVASTSFVSNAAVSDLDPLAHIPDFTDSAQLDADVRLSSNIAQIISDGFAETDVSDLDPLDHVPDSPHSSQEDTDNYFSDNED